MKVLVNTYDTAFQNKAGGVHKRIEKTVDAMGACGCQIDYFDKFSTKVEDYDILHTSMLKTSNLDLGDNQMKSSYVLLNNFQLRLNLAKHKILYLFPNHLFA